MKVSFTFKGPDSVWDGLSHAGLLIDDDANLVPEESDEVREIINKYIQYDEYVVIELDFDTGEARVVPVEEY